MIGRTFAGYAVEELVGQDEATAIYQARHEILRSKHRLKVLTKQKYGTRAVDRLRAQGQVQARLKHANIVPVTEIIDVDGLPGLIMAWVDGPNLLDWVGGDPPADSRYRVFRHILAGLSAAHAEGIVHRDLRPQRILVQIDDAGEPTARIADFGLVRFLGGGGVGTKVDDVQPMGTVCYTAPEVLTHPSDADRASDMFSLGCLLYFLATGKHAFESDKMYELLFKVNRGKFEPLPAHVPQQYRELLDELIAVDPAQRLPDCAVAIAFLRNPGWRKRRIAQDDAEPSSPKSDAPIPAPASAPSAQSPSTSAYAVLAGLILFALVLALFLAFSS